MAATSEARSSYDVVVVGARCAGAATAMLLARRGLRVLVVDRGRHGTDTLSTHALMWGGVLQLRRWGLLGAVEEAGTPVVGTTTFHYGEDVVRIPLKARDGAPGLFAPRRYVLDAILADAAAAAGAQVRYGVRVAGVLSAGGRVRGVALEDADGRATRVDARLVVGADGMRSTVASRVGAHVYRKGRHASGTVFGYFSGLEPDGYHWHYGSGAAVGVIPTNESQSCVFASASAERFRREIAGDPAAGFDRLVAECSPGLAARVARARRQGHLRGFAGEVGFVRQSWGPGWALVGDAAYFKDPITAHGITDALRDAELLARAIVQGSEAALAAYQETRDAMSIGLFEVTDEIASYEWDLAAVQRMHFVLSSEMKREVREMSALLGEPEHSSDRAPVVARTA